MDKKKYFAEKLSKAADWNKSVYRDGLHFNHPEHGTVSVIKDNDQFHVVHNTQTAGIKGKKASFATPAEAVNHAKTYIGALNAGTVAGHRMHNVSSNPTLTPNPKGRGTNVGLTPPVKSAFKKEELEKARIDEGKSPEQKVAAREKRNFRSPKEWRTGNKAHAGQFAGTPKEMGTDQSGVHSRTGTFTTKIPVSYKDVGGKRGTRDKIDIQASHTQAMKGLKGIQPKLGKSEEDYMEKTILEQAQELLKNVKENPEAIEGLEKANRRTGEYEDYSQHLPKVKDAATRRYIQEKGVHRASCGPKSAHPGTSNLGVAHAGIAQSPNSGIRRANVKRAKAAHEQVLAELKAMPTPNLGKEELDKAKLEEGTPSNYKQSIRASRKMDRPAVKPKIHQPISEGSGRSLAGSAVAGARKAGITGIGGPGMKEHLIDRAKQSHKEVLSGIQSQRNLKLGKEEHQPHPGASKSSHQAIADAKKQSKDEAHLKSPKGESERQDRNSKMIAQQKQSESIKKDDKPHAPNSPQDAAHDVVEEHKPLQAELNSLDSKSSKQKLLDHLRSLKDKSQLRSPENQEIGQSPMEKGSAMPAPAPAPSAGSMKKPTKPKPTIMPSMQMKKDDEHPRNPLRHRKPASDVKGVHISGNKPEIGQSHAGYENEKGRTDAAKEQHKNVLKEIRSMPSPKLGKSEDLLQQAQELLKHIKENPEAIEELNKAENVKTIWHPKKLEVGSKLNHEGQQHEVVSRDPKPDMKNGKESYMTKIKPVKQS